MTATKPPPGPLFRCTPPAHPASGLRTLSPPGLGNSYQFLKLQLKYFCETSSAFSRKPSDSTVKKFSLKVEVFSQWDELECKVDRQNTKTEVAVLELCSEQNEWGYRPDSS
ncbi:hypothetical protein STEG23_009050 [Scotinomys teguina]